MTMEDSLQDAVCICKCMIVFLVDKKLRAEFPRLNFFDRCAGGITIIGGNGN